LYVANALQIPTGGFAPLGYRTINGPNYMLRDAYGLIETPQRNYQVRTKKNVESSDGTLRIACNFASPGELLTKKCCDSLEKPVFDIFVRFSGNISNKYKSNSSLNQYEWMHQDYYNLMQNGYIIEAFDEWIETFNIKTLNVAGNSTQTIPEMFELAASVLTHLLGKE
jgi:hypothetical protein